MRYNKPNRKEKQVNCVVCEVSFWYLPCNKSGKYCSRGCWFKSDEFKNQVEKLRSINTGKTMSDTSRKKMSLYRKGKKQTPEHIKKRADSVAKYYDRIGRNENLTQRIKSTREYLNWRKTVFARDNYACVKCGDDKGGNLEADHIIPFSFLVQEYKMGLIDIESFYELENGRTLCEPCHRKTVSWGRGYRNAPEWKLFDRLKEINKDATPFEDFYNKFQVAIRVNADEIISNYLPR